MQKNLHENGVTDYIYPLPGSEEKFEIEDPYDLIYEGQNMDLEPYYRLSMYDEDDPLGLMYETTPAYFNEIRFDKYLHRQLLGHEILIWQFFTEKFEMATFSFVATSSFLTNL